MTSRFLPRAIFAVFSAILFVSSPASADDLVLEKVADGFDKPVGFYPYPGEPNTFLVVEQRGTIVLVRDGKVIRDPLFLDIRDRVASNDEKGLLGFAFHPKFPEVPRFYVDYTAEAPNLQTYVSEWKVDVAQHQAEPQAERVFLQIAQPFGNHNGGQIAFGPDGYLYVATGDGGGAMDPNKNGQNTKVLLGKILRLDLNVPSGYGVPSDNPFSDGVSGAREVYAFGLRNPWRFSFDRSSGQLYAADVGQETYEEIDLITRGGNYGWSDVEGARCYVSDKECHSGKYVDPIHIYGRNQGMCVTGGFVYRGKKIPWLVGTYVYGDYVTGRIWGLRWDGKAATDKREFLKTDLNISSFGEDSDGELYVVAHLQGAIYRIVSGTHQP